MTQWCGNTPSLGQERQAARRIFFGGDDPRPIDYLPGAQDFIGKERRFLGWFTFHHVQPNGEKPGAQAARLVFGKSELGAVLQAVNSPRYVTSIVCSVRVGFGFEVEVEEVRFPVRFPAMSYRLHKEDVLVCTLLPHRAEQWLLTPGWLIWPFHYGPGIRDHLRDYQVDPIEMERFLQRRVQEPADSPDSAMLRDTTLAQAVRRMTRAAEAEGMTGLILTSAGWRRLVQRHITSPNTGGFVQEVMGRIDKVFSVDEANRWLALASNIWNNTPQPDRGGKSANQLIKGYEHPQ